MCNWFHLMLTCRSKSFLKRLQTTSVHDVTFRSTQVYTAELYGCWAHKVWTGLAFRDLEVSLAKLQCRHPTRRRPNSGSFLTRWTQHSPTDDTDPVTFSNWRLFLGQFFKPLKNISKFHHFTFDISHPGTVICKEFSNSEEIKVSLLKPNIVIKKEDKPQELTAPGLDSNRQWYLYQQIMQYCRTEAAKDLTCPKPNCPKSAVKTKEDEHDSRKTFKRRELSFCFVWWKNNCDLWQSSHWHWC